MFFFQPQSDFRTQTNIQANFFYVYNVVLDILIMVFSSFFLHNFFHKRLEILFIVRNVFLCLDQCLVI